jgi:phage-related protein
MPRTEVRVYVVTSGKKPLLEWLQGLKKDEPRAYRKCLQRILQLSELGYEMTMPLARPLRDGISELRARIGNVNYRILYFFSRQTACISHGFTKEGKVPDAEIELALDRKKNVDRDFQKYTAVWEVNR